MGVRVRFAPSPTGFFHIGGARTALFNWLYARHVGGKFILRIEDTDRERHVEEATDVILSGMRWLGMEWDEGPEVGGNYGPYFQSQRNKIYEEYLEILRKGDKIYERDGAIYFRVSGEPQLIDDLIRGPVHRMEEKDFVIFRSNGTPVFHFVNVVDDAAMEISHVIRGEDHLSNSSKHVELFKAFGMPVPKFAHIPLILKTNGSGKMSKRDIGALVEDYRGKQFLPEALRNYLCLLGWSPKDDREIMPIEEVIRLFDLRDINKNNARFDDKKLAHMNAAYVKSMPLEQFLERGRNLLPDSKLAGEYGDQVLAICQEKLRSFEELNHFVSYFFNEDFEYDREVWSDLRKRDPVLRIGEFLAKIENMEGFSEEKLEEIVVKLAETYGVKTGDYIHGVRFALSGRTVGPSFYRMMLVMGRERVLKRLKRALVEIEKWK
ncbi:MAG: glutamate--tRNA ligase [Puniceicoccales bacterium]|jgi:glutamyl-tRNA synthetase|nr:glutamate--tRNA ligase [Puniceicoccales bacterium]